MEAAAILYVDEERCAGCGACVDVCPRGAISIRNGQATISQSLCNQCEACAAVCPEGAILSVIDSSLVPADSREQALQPEESIGVRSVTTRVAPVLGATLLFLGREVVPRVADYLLDAFDRRMSRNAGNRSELSETSVASSRGPGAGQRHRRRHRGG
jgi:NAD-dependent dihydropyrimidine dehydrogenase PreA subunit